MYKDPTFITLDSVKEFPQIRLGIQGFGGTGKTWSALTFPNPVVVNPDRGLGAHIGRADVTEVPIYNDTFCKTINPNHKGRDNRKDTMMIWLDKIGKKLEADQTLVWDGGSGTESAFHMWYEENKVFSNGVEDKFAQFRLKKDFMEEIHEIFKTLKCHVVWLMHEAKRRDKGNKSGELGEYSGKIRPLLTGQFQDRIVGHYTDWFRQQADEKPKEDKITDKYLADWQLTKDEFKARIEQFPRKTMYYWQTESDNIFDGKCSSLVNFPKYIFADYKDFCKFMRMKLTQIT